MKVVCQSRKRSELNIASCRQYAAETAYELSIGKTYTVYGQYLAEGCLFYLLDARDRQGLSHPTWYPASWFTVIDGSIPLSWVFSYRNQYELTGVMAVWGYPELATSVDHFEGLEERELEAMRIFLRRKAEIDAEDRSMEQKLE